MFVPKSPASKLLRQLAEANSKTTLLTPLEPEHPESIKLVLPKLLSDPDGHRGSSAKGGKLILSDEERERLAAGLAPPFAGPNGGKNHFLNET